MWWLKLGLEDVIFEGDAKELIEAVKSDEEDVSWRGHITEDIKTLRHARRRWSSGFSHREGNEVAHQMAKMALQMDGEKYWMEEVLEILYTLIVKEKECNFNN